MLMNNAQARGILEHLGRPVRRKLPGYDALLQIDENERRRVRIEGQHDVNLLVAQIDVAV